MTTDLLNDSRRPSGGSPSRSAGTPATASGETSARELPVLFQLGDVSRPRSQRSPSSPPATVSAVSAPAPKPPAPPAHQPEPAIAAAPPTESLAPLSLSELSKPYTPAALEPATLWTPSVASLLDDPSLLTGEKPAVKEKEAASQPADAAKAKTTAEPAGKSAEAAASKKKADDAAKVNWPEPREDSSKRRQPAKKNDWFSTHGKLIAIGFVVALIATVVIARNQKKAPAPSTDEQWALKHPGGAADGLGESGPAIEMPSVAIDLPPSDAQPSSKEDEASPAPVEKLVGSKAGSEAEAAKPEADSRPRVDLLPPTLPQSELAETTPAPPPPFAAADKPAAPPAAPTNTDPLFTWPQRETEVAAKPATPPAPTSTAQQQMNPGEVINPYTRSAPPSAAPAANEGPIATTASRSPYTLPTTPQDAPSAAPATSVYAPAGPTAGYTAPASGYAPAPAYSPNPGYAPAPGLSSAPATMPPSYSAPPAPAPTYSPAPPGPPPGGYAPAGNYTSAPPTTPSPYLPAGGPAATTPPTGQMPPSYGAPAGPTNTQPPSGYRYERTGSGLY